jgi:hypothetical protein
MFAVSRDGNDRSEAHLVKGFPVRIWQRCFSQLLQKNMAKTANAARDHVGRVTVRKRQVCNPTTATISADCGQGCVWSLSWGRCGHLPRAARRILSGYPTGIAALKPATSADANDGTLRIKRAVVDTIPGHGVDLLRVWREGVCREGTLR